MHNRKSGHGGPSRTDGFHFSYLMVVDSRYENVAQCKSRLSIPNLHCLLIIHKKRRRYRCSSKQFNCWQQQIHFYQHQRVESGAGQAFEFFVFGSSLASLISTTTITRSNYFLQVMKDLSSFNLSKLELIKATAVVPGLVVQVFIIGATTSFIDNAAPPKRTS